MIYKIFKMFLKNNMTSIGKGRNSMRVKGEVRRVCGKKKNIGIVKKPYKPCSPINPYLFK